MNTKPTIGVIGYGNMGAAIANQIKSDYSVFVFDTDTTRTVKAKDLAVASSIDALLSEVTVVVLAIKPQDMAGLLRKIKPFIRKEQLVISIAAGVKTSDIEAFLASQVKIVRAMPNLFAREGSGITALCKGAYVEDAELSFANEVFERFGKVRVINDEEDMDAVTAVSGSGPGYLSYLIEKDNVAPEERGKYIDEIMSEYVEAAKATGLEDAKFFAENTGSSLKVYFQTHPESPQEFRKQVTSKGGTTEAAINKLKSGGKLSDALQAAMKKAKELSENIKKSIKEG